MSAIAKTIVATGASSGLGFEAIKTLLGQAQPYKFILGARNVGTTEAAYSKLGFDSTRHTLTVLPLELSDLRTAKTFAQQTLEHLGHDKLDYLLLNAATTSVGADPSPHGPAKWCEAYVVNHLSQHYLIHLLREKLAASKSRVVVVSTGAIRQISDPKTLDVDLKAGSAAKGLDLYAADKFAQFLGAQWWRRQLQGQATVVAVSPGLIPDTGLGRGGNMTIPDNLPDAKSVAEGAASILAAFTRDDVPADPEQVFLTSWGEWWPKDVYAPALDKDLQDKWSPSKEEIEKEAGISA
ncbi:hypothetical protein B0T26DRAFT_428650 [Lasiosphaeria miniovina]|uniref:Uncharacterized protein n=1 Tax=Lasiosphaeria miniovina TaxID=1954250 RepID=A0AA40A624_9PEZI|nr:uncharacterized protein B0T26DRAFT_428650 [Lasiosphaeria miniovina]KAK0709917.1 hypothetical protein B0T26DRAFT_428650 [Lasiosphaeria miniovina]